MCSIGGKMKRIVTFFISLLLLIYTVVGAGIISKPIKEEVPLAQNGVLDLRSWNFEDGQTIELNGEWEFYPNELITPREGKDVFAEYHEVGRTAFVPGSWEEYLSDGVTTFGAGTYRLIIYLPKDDRYGVKTNTIRYASHLFLNGEHVGSSGVPTKEMDKFVGDARFYAGLAPSKENQIEVVFQVANFKYPTGGIIHAVDFGLAEDIIDLRDRNRLYDALLVSGYLLLGIYYLFSYFQRRSDKYQLFFSLLCLSQAVYVSTLNERLFNLFVPNLKVMFLTKIQLGLIHASVLFFLWFTYTLFKEYANKKLVHFLSVGLILNGLIFGIPGLSSKIFVVDQLYFVQILIVVELGLGAVYTGYLLTKAFLKRTEGSEYLLIIVTSFLCYGLILALNYLFEAEFGYIPVVLFLVMTFALSLFMGYRFQLAFKQVDQLSRELLEHDKLKDEFLAKTSHELQTPLHGILNLSQALVEGREGPLQLKQQESVLLIQNIGKRLSSLVVDLLDASKIKRGDIQYKLKAVHINMIRDVIREMHFLNILSNEVKLIDVIPDDLPPVITDEQRLKQIVFNLIHNAMKYTEKGTIYVSAYVQNEEMYVSVTDTGIGIDPEKQELIFTSFYQSENQVNGKSTGLGLGLAITKQLVETLGGRIWVSSKVGEGSCFTFTVPLAEGNMELLTESPVASAEDIFSYNKDIDTREIVNLELPKKLKGKEKYTILIVDDEHTNLKILLNLLHSWDYTVIAVDNGPDALNTIKHEVVDLMILDLMMPSMSGYEVCELVRREYHLVELPILILTAAGQMHDLIASFQAGANDFLRKPLEQEEVKARIESLLATKVSAEHAIHDGLSYYYAQITPHFLYNTLNTIISLSYIDEVKTREALEHLAIYFRAKLDFYRHHTLIPLESELELVQSYLAIEKMRFGERLKIHYDIDESITAMLPAMTIQPLVENAVEHGISKKASGGNLCISVQRDGEAGLKIIIEDDGLGMSEEKKKAIFRQQHHGLGLANTIKKLKIMKQTQLSIESHEGMGTRIIIILPEAEKL